MAGVRPVPTSSPTRSRSVAFVVILSLVPHVGLLMIHLAQDMPDVDAAVWFFGGILLTLLAAFVFRGLVRLVTTPASALPEAAFCATTLLCSLGALVLQGQRTSQLLQPADAAAVAADTPSGESSPALQLPPGPPPRNAEASAQFAEQRALLSLNDARLRAARAGEAFWSKGGPSPTGLTNVAAVEQRLALLEELSQASAGLTDVLRHVSARLEAEYDVRRVPADVRAASRAALFEKLRPATLHAVAQCDVEIAAHARAVLTLGAKHWGHWQRMTGDQMVFDNRAVQESYAGHTRALNELYQQRSLHAVQCPPLPTAPVSAATSGLVKAPPARRAGPARSPATGAP